MVISKQMPPFFKNDPDDKEAYRKRFRKDVFQLLKWGYDRLDPKQYQDSEEEVITGDFVREIESILQDRSYPEWVGRYSVHEEKPISKTERKGKRRKRLDIEIERVRHGPRPRYPFEAKRLCANTHATIGAYLGPGGLKEFLSGNYAPEETEAGMLGYVQSGMPEHWSQEAQNRLETHHELIETYEKGSWSPASILADLNYCYTSIHNRLSVPVPITLYHLFLKFY